MLVAGRAAGNLLGRGSGACLEIGCGTGALASTRWRVQISHFGAVQVRPGVSAF
jgi:hypothetical protein